MSDDTEIATRLLRIAATASNESTQEERDFSSLVTATRRNFRRNDISSPNKGRKRKKTFKKKVVLMKLAHADFFPSNVELKFLKQRGLGLSDELLEIERDRTFDEIKEDIISLFCPSIQNLLRMCGFRLGRVDKSKKLIILGDIQNGTDLEYQLKQSKLIVLPLNDFPDNLPLITQPNTFPSETARNSSTLSLTQRNNDSDTIILEETLSSTLSPQTPGCI